MTSSSPPGVDLEEVDSEPNLPTNYARLESISRAVKLETRLLEEVQTLQDYFSSPQPSDGTLIARLALLSANGLQVHGLQARPDAFVVVGRHCESQVRVDDASWLSLRHVLVIPSAC